MSKAVIFLDFDGVLCDSAKEAYLLSRYAYLNISPFVEIEEQIYQQFRKFRPSVTNSWQYYNFFADKKETYNSITIDFNEKFLSMRKELITNHKEFWLSLESKTDFLDKIKPLIEKTPDSFRILSTKNREAILEKLSSWGINLPSEYIYDKKDLVDVSKGVFINNLGLKKALLIDDSLENIESCKEFDNIEPILTSWGYVENQKNASNEDTIIQIIKEQLS